MIGNNEQDNDEQIGAIIVSVTDQLFSDKGTGHVRISIAIEIRLVDQDFDPLSDA